MHVVHPVILLEHAEHAVLLDLYCPDAHDLHVDPLAIKPPLHLVHDDADEHVEQLV